MQRGKNIKARKWQLATYCHLTLLVTPVVLGFSQECGVEVGDSESGVPRSPGFSPESESLS